MGFLSVCTGGARGASFLSTYLGSRAGSHGVTHTHHTHTPRLVRLDLRPIRRDRRRDNDGVEMSVGRGHPAVHHTCFRYECVWVCVCVCVWRRVRFRSRGKAAIFVRGCRFLQCKDGESSQRISSETLFRPVRRLTLGLPRSKVVHCWPELGSLGSCFARPPSAFFSLQIEYVKRFKFNYYSNYYF